VRSSGVAIVFCAALAHSAAADPARTHVEEGEALARSGRWSEAIAAFKTADRLTPRAHHACLIGLAYIRRELWTQAELFLALCRERTRPDDPAPEWLDLAESQLRQRSEYSSLAPVDIIVEPASVSAQIVVSSLASDEPFAPKQIHLPRGHHVITARAPQREPVQAVIEIDDTSARRVVLRFDRSPHRSRVPTVLTAVGGVTLAAGLAYHTLALSPVRDELAAAADPNAPDLARYDRYSATFDRRRAVTYGLYGAGGALLLTGVVLRYTVYRDAPERAPHVSAHVGGGTTTLAVEWQR
jgi:hypothetical protein